MKGEIFMGRVAHIDALYGLLNHVDLGRDAANLYRPGAPERSWAEELFEAYHAAPGRFELHVLPLVTRDAVALERALEDPPSPLDDTPGRRLCALVRAVMHAERAERTKTFEQRAQSANIRSTNFLSSWGRTLRTLRAVLHGGRSSPMLYIIDSPALSAADGAWTHGRALSRAGLSMIAVSLDVPQAHALLQIFHEEIHRVTEPLVLKRLDERVVRDQGAEMTEPEVNVHALLEEVAVAHGEALIHMVAPELSATFADWRARWSNAQSSGSST